MTMIEEKPTLEGFSDKEIQDEYIERFGDPEEPDLTDFTASDLIDELERRDQLPGAEAPSDRLLDFVAEAALVSPAAAEAYALLVDDFPGEMPLKTRQSILRSRRAAA